VSGDEDRVELLADAPHELRPAIARALLAAGLDLLRLDVGRDRLESLFLRLTGGAEK
jgi:ABC-2 type transport system ATP-binding protein